MQVALNELYNVLYMLINFILMAFNTIFCTHYLTILLYILFGYAKIKLKLEEEIWQLQQLAQLQGKQIESITSEQDAAESHCVLMQHQNTCLLQQINNQKSHLV